MAGELHDGIYSVGSLGLLCGKGIEKGEWGWDIAVDERRPVLIDSASIY